MKAIKSIIPVVLMLVLIFATIGPTFADDDEIPIANETPIIRPIDPMTLFSGYVTVEFNQTTAHVGDTVLITVTANNNGLVDWSPLEIYAPIPNGMKYVSHVVPDKVRQNYDPNTGIWDVNRMRSDERGLLKTLVITVKVLPEAAGKELTATARFQTLVLEGYGIHMEDTEYVAAARAHTATVLSGDINDDNTKPPQRPGTGGGDGGGNGTGVGPFNGNGNNLIDTMKNLTASSDNPLSNLQKGGGGNEKAYEVSKAPTTQDDTLGLYILAILLIIGLIAIGYFYGIRNKR